MTKFDNVPVEDDVTILLETEAMLGERQILYQQWVVSGGIKAESIIFANADIAGIDDSVIEEMVRKSPMVNEGSSMTIKQVSGFTFCNFNFRSE